MADTFTVNLVLTKPEVGASTDLWGTKSNANWDTLAALFGAGPVLLLANGGTGAADASGARANLGLGSMALQAASAVTIAGGTMAGVTITTAPSVSSNGSVESKATGFIFPDTTVQSTAALTSGASNWQTKTANFATVNGGAYYVTVNGVVVTLHSGVANDTIRLVSGLAAGSSFTVNPAGGRTIMGGASLVVDKAYAPLALALIGTDWRVV